jgi:hypothetical protein
MEPYIVHSLLSSSRRPAMVAFASILAAACSFPGSMMTVGVVVPGVPAVWAEATGWEVSVVSCEGSPDTVYALPGTVVYLELPRSFEAAVMCTAHFNTGTSLPYGSPWPQGLADDGMLHPDASGGYACALAAVLYRGGATHAGFDLPRFAKEAEARMADPWAVDPGGFAAIVAEGRFRADHLESPDPVAVVLTGIPCALSPDSPWGTVVEPDGAGTVNLGVVPGRVHRWQGSGYELTVGISGSGEASWTLFPSPP